MLRLRWPLFVFILSITFGALSHWQVFESDLFWQIRQGEENVMAKYRDDWSTTADPDPWYNYQWLASRAVYVWSKAFGVDSIPTLRAGLVAVLVALLTCTLSGGAVVTSGMFALFWVAGWGRFQIRPELFGVICFVGLLNDLPKGDALRAPWLRALLWIALWSNFHAGTAPFGILVVGLWAVFSEGITSRNRVGLVIASVVGWFMTPIGWNILPVFYKTVFRYDWSLIMNPDQQPLTPALFNPGQPGSGPGFGMIAWAIFAVLAWISVQKTGSRAQKVIQLVLFGLVVGKIRSRIYHLVFALPLVVSWMETLPKKWKWILSLAGLSLITIEATQYAPPLGRGLLPGMFPVGAVSWIKTHKPIGPIYNAYRFGGYLVHELREYPVSEDGRSIPFLGFRTRLDAALQSPETFNQFLDVQGFKLAIDHPSFPWYQKERWERVYFDQVAAIYIRK